MKQIILTADDYGLHPDIDQGIEAGILNKSITHVCLVANGKSFKSAVGFLKQNPHISMGVHLNLTDGKPLTQSAGLKPILDSSGNFKGSHVGVIIKALFNTSLKLAIREEWKAQVNKINHEGMKVLQVTTHGHLHALPSLFVLACELAQEFHIPFVRLVDEIQSMKYIMTNPIRYFKAMIITLLFSIGKKRSKVFHNVKLIKTKAVRASQKISIALFEEQIQRGPNEVMEIVFHPAKSSTNLDRAHPWNSLWKDELKFLLSEECSEIIRSENVSIISFDEVKHNV